MIDLNRLRDNPQQTKRLITLKDPAFNVDRLIELDAQVRQLRTNIDEWRKDRNDLSAKGAKGNVEQVRQESISLGKKIKEAEEQLTAIEQEFERLALSCPNLPHDELPHGGKEANKEIRSWGTIPAFDFPFKNHVELNQKLGWFDVERAALMSGSQFVLYKEPGVKVIYALTQLMLKNNVRQGYSPIIPPYLVYEKALKNAGELPKFAGAYYAMPDDGLCLIPTSEVSLTNIYADTILSADQLPLRMTSWTSCFRREAGGYGAQERGLIRIHQFEKVEIYAITEPEKSYEEQERMIATAEEILKQLGLHYRVMLLATQDCSFQSARTFDIEVWLPGQNRYYEVSSASNCTDFQARRSGMRYRSAAQAKPRLVHTLNASSLALPRLMVALMENYQQPDGSVVLPAALQNLMDVWW